MSNWKVGPGGRLYHPTTGAYVGQLDDNGNEQMVVSSFPSESGRLFAGENEIGVSIAVDSITATSPPLTGTTTETERDSVLIPAGLVKPFDRLDLYAFFEAPTGTGGAKTLSVRVDNVTGTTLVTATATSNQSVDAKLTLVVGADGTTCRVHAVATSMGSTSAPGTVTLDFSADVILSITGKLAAAGDSITLLHWILVRNAGVDA